MLPKGGSGVSYSTMLIALCSLSFSQSWSVSRVILIHVQIIEDAAMHDQYCRVITPEPAINEETEEVCALLKQCYQLR